MDRHRFRMLTRLILLATALFWAMGLGLAQMQSGGKSPAQTGPYRTPQSPNMRMRSMTMAQRKAAAQRNAARRAAALQKSRNAATSQGEVTK